MNNNESTLVSRYCQQCKADTNHHLLMISNSAVRPESKKERIKVFMTAFFAGWGAGRAASFMDLRDKHLICDVCGTKIIESFGDQTE
ncbi:hypothetical protein FR932_05865 [Moritella marina ATCC 15381]|uniref:Uncharacterized protein n=1 Tax=Moritella marina ATCC 15381 TaxID=1202962 RepID=A0A5J6WJE7_MORMI|nr:hypothetical protein [Moritella marina]QFI37388.1 hypothetical protein FR932_05865 [Moritella marina ATCC 15381]